MLRNWKVGACVLLGLSALALPALAQTKAQAGATAADPTFDAARAAAAAQGAGAFSAIQMDLIWTGDLNSLPTGEFGRRSYDAIRAFQKRIKVKDTGILLPPQRAVLAQHAAKFTDRYGFTTITEHGLVVGYPAKIASKRTEGRNGPNFSSPKGDVSIDVLNLPADKENFDSLFARMKTERPGRKVTYSLLRPDFFVVTGVNDGKNFYLRFVKTDGFSRGFALGWDPALSPAFDRVAIAMASALRAPGAGEAAAVPAKPATGPARKPVAPTEPPKPAGPPVPLPAGAPATPRTGIGALVSDKGDILTYADAVAGCMTVTMADGSRAKVIGGDPGNDIAVVRLAGPAGPAPLSWRTAPLAAGEAVSLLSGASPAAATVTALSGPGADTRRVGLSAGGGGALVDKDGALVGLAAADGSAVALKALFVTAFLRANGATPPAKGGDAARDAVSFRCEPGK